MTELVHYEAMCREIAECARIDEVKDIRDRAAALLHYARQAKNFEAERQCERIRVRAEREWGKRYQQSEKATAGRTKRNWSNETTDLRPSTLDSMGVSRDQSAEWQRLADVPEDVFERELATQDHPSASSIIYMANPTPTPVQPVEREALRLWGRLCEFERDEWFARDPVRLMETMTEQMRADTLRLAPLVIAWLARIGGEDGQGREAAV